MIPAADRSAATAPRLLVLACGALAREIRDVSKLHEIDNLTLECLPASLHNRPERIPGELRARLTELAGQYDQVLLGYADCGTGGELDRICDEFGIERLPGAHCYQFFAGGSVFTEMHEDDPTAFYLTDYLAKHFERIILEGLGINAHPELLPMYFGNYTRLVYLAQTDDPVIAAKAEAAADALGLAFDRITTGYGELQSSIVRFVNQPSVAGADS